MKYHFKIYKEEKHFWAHCLELQGCVTQAATMPELYLNMKEALNLYITQADDSDDLAALPSDEIKTSKSVVAISLDPHIAFSFLMRYFRRSHNLSQQELAGRMGFDRIWSYQRLEFGKCNPTLAMLSKVKEIFPEFSIDYMLT